MPQSRVVSQCLPSRSTHRRATGAHRRTQTPTRGWEEGISGIAAVVFWSGGARAGLLLLTSSLGLALSNSYERLTGPIRIKAFVPSDSPWREICAIIVSLFRCAKTRSCCEAVCGIANRPCRRHPGLYPRRLRTGSHPRVLRSHSPSVCVTVPVSLPRSVIDQETQGPSSSCTVALSIRPGPTLPSRHTQRMATPKPRVQEHGANRLPR